MIDKSKWQKVDWSNYKCEKETFIGNNAGCSFTIDQVKKIQSGEEKDTSPSRINLNQGFQFIL